MNPKILFLLFAVIVLIAFTGCTQSTPSTGTDFTSECINLCNAELQNGTDLSNGPCLSNSLAGNSEWVCDVAHSPRESVDNLPENQCSAFGQGTAKHFVEVSLECEFIKQY